MKRQPQQCFIEYTDKMILWIDRNCKRYEIGELSWRFNMTFGVYVTDKALHSAMKRYGIQTGRTGQFQKGHETWNAGTAGTGLMKRNVTTFRKGNRPANEQPVGAERITKDDLIQVKVRMKGKHTGEHWQSKHSLLWEQHHGRKVPKGHIVMFADGDRRNFDIRNLILVSRAGNAIHNKRGYTYAHKSVRPTLVAVAELDATINNRRKKK